MKGQFVRVQSFLIGAKPWSGTVMSDAFMDAEGTFWLLVANGGKLQKVDAMMVTLTKRLGAQFEQDPGTGHWRKGE